MPIVPFQKEAKFPFPEPFIDNVETHNIYYESNVVKGPVGDSDRYELPKLASQGIEYFNSLGASVWALTKADFVTAGGAITNWAGVFKAPNQDILVVGIDTSTAPDTYRVFTIDPLLGTLTFEFADQPPIDFAVVPNFNTTNTFSTGMSRIYFNQQAELPELWVYNSQSGSFDAEIWRMQISLFDQIVTQPILASKTAFGLPMRVLDSRSVTIQTAGATTPKIVVTVGDRDTYRTYTLSYDWSGPLPNVSGIMNALDWDDLYYFNTLIDGNITISGQKVYEKEAIQSWVDSIDDMYNTRNWGKTF